jgi:hypothetical protein
LQFQFLLSTVDARQRAVENIAYADQSRDVGVDREPGQQVVRRHLQYPAFV